MLTPAQQSRLDRKCVAAAARAIDAFDMLLAQCEADAAASIVADLIKAHFDRPIAQPDPAAALAEIVNRAMSLEDPPDEPAPSLSLASPFARPSGPLL